MAKLLWTSVGPGITLWVYPLTSVSIELDPKDTKHNLHGHWWIAPAMDHPQVARYCHSGSHTASPASQQHRACGCGKGGWLEHPWVPAIPKCRNGLLELWAHQGAGGPRIPVSRWPWLSGIEKWPKSTFTHHPSQLHSRSGPWFLKW